MCQDDCGRQAECVREKRTVDRLPVRPRPVFTEEGKSEREVRLRVEKGRRTDACEEFRRRERRSRRRGA